MGLGKVIQIKNGPHFEDYNIYICDRCGCEIEERWPRDNDTPGKDYCFDCSFKMGRIDWKTWIDAGTGWNSWMAKAAICPTTGEIEIAPIRGKFSWEKRNQDHRNTVQYQEWRSSVFQRDNYTCQRCGKKGTTLNAHHIEPFNRFEKLRYEITNGITLCVKCHREHHKKLRAVAKQ